MYVSQPAETVEKCRPDVVHLVGGTRLLLHRKEGKQNRWCVQPTTVSRFLLIHEPAKRRWERQRENFSVVPATLESSVVLIRPSLERLLLVVGLCAHLSPFRSKFFFWPKKGAKTDEKKKKTFVGAMSNPTVLPPSVMMRLLQILYPPVSKSRLGKRKRKKKEPGKVSDSFLSTRDFMSIIDVSSLRFFTTSERSLYQRLQSLGPNFATLETELKRRTEIRRHCLPDRPAYFLCSCSGCWMVSILFDGTNELARKITVCFPPFNDRFKKKSWRSNERLKDVCIDILFFGKKEEN